MDPFIGVLWHAVGGFFHGSFYFPLTKIKHWAWETYWLMQGLIAWIIMPLLISLWLVPELMAVFKDSSWDQLFMPALFGFLWGMGSLTFGLTIRYLGMSLGMSLALGFSTSLGTLIPPIYAGNISALFTTASGLIVFIGVSVCLFGIAIVGYAGSLKEKQLSETEKRNAIKEFALKKGILIATFSGVMSACFAFGIQAGHPVALLAVEHGAKPIFQNSPVFILVMGGGFICNVVACIILSIRNKSYFNFIRGNPKQQKFNYTMAILGGVMWYTGFFFYGIGTTFMGIYDFSSWSIHMAFVIFFSNLSGVLAKEWAGVRAATVYVVYVGLVILVLSTLIIGYGNSLTENA